MIIYSIYKITNLVNNKIYIGWTYRKPAKRFHEHSTRNNCPIAWSINKYGSDNFCFDIIYQTKDLVHSREMETYFIKEYNSLVEQYGYNRDLGGTGHKRTAATIEKHREKMLGKKQSEEHIQKRIKRGADNPSYGKLGKDAHAYGKKQSEHQKQRTREANSKSYIITFPDGTETKITNLRQFALAHNLDPGNLSKVAYGIVSQHKGFKARHA